MTSQTLKTGKEEKSTCQIMSTTGKGTSRTLLLNIDTPNSESLSAEGGDTRTEAASSEPHQDMQEDRLNQQQGQGSYIKMNEMNSIVPRGTTR